MKFKRVVIIGMGLIGGSIGKALLEKGSCEVIGVCRRESSLERAVKEKSLTKGFVNSYAEAASGADLIIIATPVHTIKTVLDGLAEVLSGRDVIVTDVGSTKREIVEYAGKYADKFTFIGSHPLAGSEKTGVEAARPDLFKGSVCVVTSDGGKDITSLKEFWEGLGSEVSVMDSAEHDRILAFTSHLPHVVAYALAGVQKEKFFKFASTGFRDTTRIASSDEGLWTDIFLSNKDNVLESIKVFKAMLEVIESDLESGDDQSLKERIGNCRKVRDGVCKKD